MRSPVTSGISDEVIYATPTRPVLYEETLTKLCVEVVGHDEPLIEQEVLGCNTRQFGALASPYASPYVYKKQLFYVDKQYGIRKFGEKFMINN
jgi:hypothetical protein